MPKKAPIPLSGVVKFQNSSVSTHLVANEVTITLTSKYLRALGLISCPEKEYSKDVIKKFVSPCKLYLT